MTPQPVICQYERIDDVPLLFGMMTARMNIDKIIDKHLPRHHLHQGLSSGNLAVGWMSYVLSQSDHRKSSVQGWANNLSHTLETLYGTPLRPQEFSDDRLGNLLSGLAEVDWDALERDLFSACFEVYQLPTDDIRVDSTASCGYHTITTDGIMQLGHSKDHRPDLPQLKVMAAVTQPLGFPLSTAVVAGNRADDGLYWHTIQQVQKLIGRPGLLFAGDNKMAALETRGRIAKSNDLYLTPLPHTGQTARLFDSWVEQALTKGDGLTHVWEPEAKSEPELLAKGYEFTRSQQVDLDGVEYAWTERVQVVQSVWLHKKQKETLEKNLQQAEERLKALTLSGKGRRVWRDEEELRTAVAAILEKNDCTGLLDVAWSKEETQTPRYASCGRPVVGALAELEVEVRYKIGVVQRNEERIKHRQERLGWRAQVTNASERRLSLSGSVLTYRAGAGLERPFHQLKDAPLGIRPLFVRTDEQILGLTRLLLIALRVQTLVEIVVRKRLAEQNEALPGLYEGQKNRTESKPTAKRLLAAIAREHISITKVVYSGEEHWIMKPLPELLLRTLGFLGLAPSLYTDLVRSSSDAATPTTIASG